MPNTLSRVSAPHLSGPVSQPTPRRDSQPMPKHGAIYPTTNSLSIRRDASYPSYPSKFGAPPSARERRRAAAHPGGGGRTHKRRRESTATTSPFPRRREGGFTFQVQHAGPRIISAGVSVVQALSRGIIVGLNHLCKRLHLATPPGRSCGAESAATGRWRSPPRPSAKGSGYRRRRFRIPRSWSR